MRPLGILAAGNTLGEGIVWDGRDYRLWWTDIAERRLYCHDPASNRTDSHALPDRAGSFGLVQGDRRLIVAFAREIALYSPLDGSISSLWKMHDDVSGVRLNDGRVDRSGRFWCASMVEDDSGEAKAALYCVDRGAVRPVCAHLHIGNGLAFSPDGNEMYFADSLQHTIWRHALHADGLELGRAQVFARTSPDAFPDGAAVDVDGGLWIAHWGAGCIVRYTPAGRVDRVVPVPASQPSCLCFGGPQRDLLFVTTARIGLSPQKLASEPHAGDVFVYRVDTSGISEPEYRP
ncbi:MAG: SMP-30/gluconolactonase/LRE family protein [Rhodanobacteraceae bacterium]|nr:SMP-30/gluconolactonase/LRE family protein [Rhodanobacteraceae bacterium]